MKTSRVRGLRGIRDGGSDTHTPASLRQARASSMAEDHSLEELRRSSHLEGQGLPRFYDTSFSTFRVSPLHIGATPLHQARLHVLELRLRDALIGDVVRGVHLAGSSAVAALMGRSGALVKVTIEWTNVEALLQSSGNSSAAHDSSGSNEGLIFTVLYEHAAYAALLLPALQTSTYETEHTPDLVGSKLRWSAVPEPMSQNNRDRTKNRPGNKLTGDNGPCRHRSFISLPLLLVRMPAPLKVAFLDYLQQVFDVRIGPLQMGTRTLVNLLDSWIQHLVAEGEPRSSSWNKDVLITLAFNLPPPSFSVSRPPSTNADTMDGIKNEVNEDKSRAKLGLRTLDVVIPAPSIQRWCKLGREKDDRSRTPRHWVGNAGERAALSQGKAEEGWGWGWMETDGSVHEENENNRPRSGFLEGLAMYLDESLALDIFHPLVKITKVACGGFAVSEDRLKVYTAASSVANTDALALADVHPIAWQLLSTMADSAQGEVPKDTGLYLTQGKK